jgi:cell division protein FtsL
VSAPARKIATPRPHGPERPRSPRRRAAPNRAAPHRAAPHRAAPRGVAPRSRRKQHRLGFALFAFALVGSLVLGIVVLHALLAQQSFRIAEAEQRIEALDQERLELVREQATRSAPGRIAAWATRHDMRLPDDIRILRAPDGPGDPAGAAVSSEAKG